MHRIVCAFAENVTTEDEIFFLHSMVLLIFMHRGHCHRERWNSSERVKKTLQVGKYEKA